MRITSRISLRDGSSIGVEREGGSSGGNPEVKSIGEHREGNALFSSAAFPLFPS